jgi:hypothetical protein
MGIANLNHQSSIKKKYLCRNVREERADVGDSRPRLSSRDAFSRGSAGAS